MMRTGVSCLLVMIALSAVAQVGGGSAAFSQRDTGADAARARELAKRKDDPMPTPNSVFIDASVLINVKADEYVVVFAISREGATLEEARQSMDTAVNRFQEELRRRKVRADDINVDFVSQNRIYGFVISADLAKEEVLGFEVKKNVSVRFDDIKRLDELTAAASLAEVFDLVKVDYIVRNLSAVQTRLLEEAARVVQRKVASHQRLMGLRLGPPLQIYAEKYSAYYPTDMYSSYVAQESESFAPSRQNLSVQRARKPRSFFFDPMSAAIFDQVVNPALTEPMVQFTLYYKVRYESILPGSTSL